VNRTTAQQLLDVLRLRSVARDQPAPVAWTEQDVRGLVPLLEREGAQVWLYRRIQQGRVTVPDGLKAALRDAVHRTSVVNMRIDAQTVAVTTLFGSAGIPWALLKGQARRAAAKRYPFADARPVSDVDLLVPDARADEAWQLLCNQGFRRVIEEPVDWTADHHRPTLIDANNVAVEVHTTTSMTVPPAEAWRRATEHADAVEWSDKQTCVPNATELVWQALSHGVADGHTGFVLKAFLSVAAVLAVRPNVDWSVIAQRTVACETVDNETHTPVTHERVREFLCVAAWLADVTIPETLQPKHHVDFATVLMWRSRVLSSGYGRAVKERLLEEAGRVVARQPITPIVKGAGLLRNVRRRGSSLVARGLFVAWRSTFA